MNSLSFNLKAPHKNIINFKQTITLFKSSFIDQRKLIYNYIK